MADVICADDVACRTDGVCRARPVAWMAGDRDQAVGAAVAGSPTPLDCVGLGIDRLVGLLLEVGAGRGRTVSRCQPRV